MESNWWESQVERGLIAPDKTEVETERSEHLARRTYKDGHIEWIRAEHDLEGYEQDVLEEAYSLGYSAHREGR